MNFGEHLVAATGTLDALQRWLAEHPGAVVTVEEYPWQSAPATAMDPFPRPVPSRKRGSRWSCRVYTESESAWATDETLFGALCRAIALFEGTGESKPIDALQRR